MRTSREHRPRYYRVWSNTGRMRRFAERVDAIACAERLYIAQGLADVRPVQVDLGASFPIGEYGPWGWRDKP